MKKFIFFIFLIAITLNSEAHKQRPGHSHHKPPAKPPQGQVEHPLTPLTATEIRKTHDIIASYFTDPVNHLPREKLRIPVLVLKEPAKDILLGWRPGKPVAREANVEILHYPSNRLWTARVDLKASVVKSLVLTNAGTQPVITADEFVVADQLVHDYEPWKHAIRQRGLDPADIYVDVWAPGDFQLPADVVAKLPFGNQTRLLQALAFWRNGDAETMDDDMPHNPYARPIEGLVVTLDMNSLKVAHMTNTPVRPVSNERGNAAIRRTDLKPLKVSQPASPSFNIDGHQVHWQKWNFFVYLHPREGLVISDLRYGDGNESRRIAHRLSMVDIYVPYGLGDKNWTWRSAFDVGEYNLANYAQTLEVNADVPANARFIDAVFANDTGPADDNPNGTVEFPATIGIYERESGILWTRTDPSTYARDTRYGRELVVTWNAWIGNYIYAFDWIFKMDGSLEVKTHLNGATLNRGASDGNDETGAPLVGIGPNGVRVAAPNHQHFFNFRLDFDIDGIKNIAAEENITHVEQPGFENVFDETTTVFSREGYSDFNVATSRGWMFESATAKNALGNPTGFAIEASPYAPPLSSANFPPLQRAQFANHQFWLTRYKEGEFYSVGDYPNQGVAGDGLPKYITPAEPLDTENGDDLVAWFTTGFTHVPRPEDYPVMPTETLSFKIIPHGFFSSNPALDVPKQ